MLESIAAECHKRNKAVLYIANASKRLERSIKATIKPEHIKFVSNVLKNHNSTKIWSLA